MTTAPSDTRNLRVTVAPDLPAEGQQLLDRYDNDRGAIQEEANRKIEVRHAELIRSLEELQDRYAKAGKLDEAVAVRDYIRALGQPRIIRR